MSNHAMLCPTCGKRKVIIDRCIVCLFLRDEAQRAVYYTLFEELVVNDSTVLYLNLQEQIELVYYHLPYTRDYKAKHKQEICWFVQQSVVESLEIRAAAEQQYQYMFINIDDPMIGDVNQLM